MKLVATGIENKKKQENPMHRKREIAATGIGNKKNKRIRSRKHEICGH